MPFFRLIGRRQLILGFGTWVLIGAGSFSSFSAANDAISWKPAVCRGWGLLARFREKPDPEMPPQLTSDVAGRLAKVAGVLDDPKRTDEFLTPLLEAWHVNRNHVPAPVRGMSPEDVFTRDLHRLISTYETRYQQKYKHGPLGDTFFVSLDRMSSRGVLASMLMKAQAKKGDGKLTPADLRKELELRIGEEVAFVVNPPDVRDNPATFTGAPPRGPQLVKAGERLDNTRFGTMMNYRQPVVNPTATRVDELLKSTPDGKAKLVDRDGKALTGKFLFTVVQRPNGEHVLVIADEHYKMAASGLGLLLGKGIDRWPHPTCAALVDGDGKVAAAGVVYIDGGKLVRVTNQTGHFGTTPRELAEVAAPAFEKFKAAYAPGFQGFVTLETDQKLPWRPENPTHLIVPTKDALERARAELKIADRFRRDIELPLGWDPGQWERDVRERFQNTTLPHERNN